MRRVVVRAHTNIALIKYWGKSLIPPYLPEIKSISITLPYFHTTTSIELTGSKPLTLFLNNQEVDTSNSTFIRVFKFISWFFKELNLQFSPLNIKTYNNFPTTSGLASSASAYASLTYALLSIFKPNFTLDDFIYFSIRGSGSAPRSYFPGIVAFDPLKSALTQLVDAYEIPFGMFIVRCGHFPKTYTSREAMTISELTSPYYKTFKNENLKDYQKALFLISRKKWYELGELVIHNTMKMFAVIHTSYPPILYWNECTIKVLNRLIPNINPKDFFFTMDAGPHVKIFAFNKEKVYNLVSDLSYIYINSFKVQPIVLLENTRK